MNREENIKKIREACIKVNHKIATDRICSCPLCENDVGRNIHLSDILLTIGVKDKATNSFNDTNVDQYGRIYHNDLYQADWNLLKDDLTQQSDETLSFVANLLQ